VDSRWNSEPGQGMWVESKKELQEPEAGLGWTINGRKGLARE
jgi:hypothetical protein